MAKIEVSRTIRAPREEVFDLTTAAIEDDAELEVTEIDHPARVRTVTAGRATRRETTFTYLNTRDGTDVHLAVVVRPSGLLGRIRSWFVRDPLPRDLEADLDAVQAHFERD